jgi:tetratricopeptide (TPR) repeat protein
MDILEIPCRGGPMRFRRRLAAAAVLTVFGCGAAASQTSDRPLTLSPECADRNRKAMRYVALEQLAEAGAELSAALSRVDNGADGACAGLILHNLATIASLSGRFADAERLAVRSIAELEKVYPSDDRALLRPLMVLAGARLEQGNKSRARADLRRLTEIRPEQLQDRALLHGATGSLFQSVGRRRDAEGEYIAAMRAWEASGHGESADAAAVLTSLATLLIEERRFDEAQRSVDRVAAILSQTKDAAPMDHSKLLMVCGTLHARRHEWPSAEKDFRESLAIAESQPAVNTGYILKVLTSFTQALSKNHHRQEGRRMEARAAGLRPASPSSQMVVDVSDIRAHPKSEKKYLPVLRSDYRIFGANQFTRSR